MNYLLATYITDDIIARANKKSESYKQFTGVHAALHTKRLYTNPLRFRIVYAKKRFTSLFVEGLGESVRNNMRVYLVHHPRSLVAELATYADKLIKVADRSVGSPVSVSKLETSRVSRWPHKSSLYAVARNKKNNTIKAPSNASPGPFNGRGRANSQS